MTLNLLIKHRNVYMRFTNFIGIGPNNFRLFYTNRTFYVHVVQNTNKLGRKDEGIPQLTK